MQPRILEVRTKILKDNDRVARDLRTRFDQARVLVASFVSSPGAGKTTLLQKLLTILSKKYRLAALVGDLSTENDARRLAESGVPTRQIITGTVCHLEAAMIEKSLDDWNLNDLDFLFIENVGNLVCPASYDLGEHIRFVLLNCTEGEDKPLKYPTIFNTADITIITKIDLAEVAEFDRPQAHTAIQTVRPGMEVIEVSSKKESGLDPLVALLENRLQSLRSSVL